MIDDLKLDEVYWAQEEYNPELDMSYNRRKDSRSDEAFASNMADVYETEKYGAERLMEKLELYSPYPVIHHEILVSPDVYTDSNYVDEGDLVVSFDVNGETIKVIFDIKAVPPKNQRGKSLRNHKSLRINMDSHGGMKKKGHVAITMIGTTYDTERLNVLVTSDLENIDDRLNWSSSPRMGHHEYDDKYYYDLDEKDEVFDIPWFSMTDPNPSDDSIDNFREMIRRAVE